MCNQYMNYLFTNKILKRVVNVYQLKFANGKAAGMGDYLRGCYCLMQVCSNLGLEFDMDVSNHPISKFLAGAEKNNDCDYSSVNKYCDVNFEPTECTYFNRNPSEFYKNFVLYLNTATSEVYYINLTAYPIRDISLTHRKMLQFKIYPSQEMTNYVMSTLISMKLQPKQFQVLHIRTGDQYVLDKQDLEIKTITNYAIKISKIIQPTCKYLLLSDNSQLKNTLNKLFPNLIAYNSTIEHTGETETKTDSAIRDTMLDFFIMTFAKKITILSRYLHGSGFSKYCAVTYGIPYREFYINFEKRFDKFKKLSL